MYECRNKYGILNKIEKFGKSSQINSSLCANVDWKEKNCNLYKIQSLNFSVNMVNPSHRQGNPNDDMSKIQCGSLFSAFRGGGVIVVVTAFSIIFAPISYSNNKIAYLFYQIYLIFSNLKVHLLTK